MDGKQPVQRSLSVHHVDLAKLSRWFAVIRTRCSEFAYGWYVFVVSLLPFSVAMFIACIALTFPLEIVVFSTRHTCFLSNIYSDGL